MSAQAGYSGAPLPQKLGLKDGQVIGFSGLPAELGHLATSRDFAEAEVVEDWAELGRDDYDCVHLFTRAADTIDAATPELRRRIKRDGMIWMSWPKKASKVPTDVTEDVIRSRALEDILVDVKVCAVDEIWSGLKLVIRKELR